MAINAASEYKLRGCRILVVEDDYFIASDVRESLEDAGCEVIGPFPSIEEPLAEIVSRTPDAAVLDVNLSGDSVYPLARLLLSLKVPVLFVTGYDPKTINPHFRSVPRLVKPISARQLQKALTGLILETVSPQDRTRSGH